MANPTEITPGMLAGTAGAQPGKCLPWDNSHSAAKRVLPLPDFGYNARAFQSHSLIADAGNLRTHGLTNMCDHM